MIKGIDRAENEVLYCYNHCPAQWKGEKAPCELKGKSLLFLRLLYEKKEEGPGWVFGCEYD